MANKNELEQKIIEYCTAEGILREKIPKNDNIEFGYNLTFPPNHPEPKRMMVLQPKGKQFIAIQIGIQISNEHVAILNKDQNIKLLFFEILKRYLLNKDIMFNLDINQNRYLISEQIYEDGLSLDNFYRNLRRVFNASIYSNAVLLDMISGKGGKLASQKNGTSSIGEQNFNASDFYFS